MLGTVEEEEEVDLVEETELVNTECQCWEFGGGGGSRPMEETELVKFFASVCVRVEEEECKSIFFSDRASLKDTVLVVYYSFSGGEVDSSGQLLELVKD